GLPVTAHDFEYSWKRVLNPATASQYAYILYFIKGAEEYNTGKVKDPAMVGVKALGDFKLQVQLTHPTPFFPHLVSYYTYRPVPKKTVERHGDKWTHPEHIVSNGAYRIVSWIPQKEILMGKNPHYWEADNVKIPKAKFLPVEDRETALKLHLNGKVHYSEDLPYLKIPELKKRGDYQDGPAFITYYYQFNTRRKPFDDVRVRRALNRAIDKKRITEFMKKGDFPVTHLTPSGMKGYTPPEGDSFDPVQAKKLLAEAGFTDPATFPAVSIYYNTSENHKTIAELIQHMWKENLGISVGLINQEWKVVTQTYQSGNYDIGRMAWIGDYLDPYTFLTLLTSGSQQNETGWGNSVYDDLVLNQSAVESNPKKREKLLQTAEKLLLDETVIIPLYQYNLPILVDPRLKGFYNNPLKHHPLKFASFEE
ncbi:MAG: peptide ABC transporter substrate-binding protein, partial [bacterium]|nr:peptide ABC transporter substrate-binding protein [bacterium]